MREVASTKLLQLVSKDRTSFFLVFTAPKGPSIHKGVWCKRWGAASPPPPRRSHLFVMKARDWLLLLLGPSGKHLGSGFRRKLTKRKTELIVTPARSLKTLGTSTVERKHLDDTYSPNPPIAQAPTSHILVSKILYKYTDLEGTRKPYRLRLPRRGKTHGGRA